MTDYWTGENMPMHDVSTEKGVPNKSTAFLCNALFCNAQSTTKTHAKKGKTRHTLRIMQVNVCIPHKLIELLIIFIFSIYCLALLNESLEHVIGIGNEAMKSKANLLRCVVQY